MVTEYTFQLNIKASNGIHKMKYLRKMSQVIKNITLMIARRGVAKPNIPAKLCSYGLRLGMVLQNASNNAKRMLLKRNEYFINFLMRFCCIPQGVASLWGSANPCLFRVFCLKCHQWFWFCFVFFYKSHSTSFVAYWYFFICYKVIIIGKIIADTCKPFGAFFKIDL